MNPFHLDGWQAVLATLIVCQYVGGYVAASAWATVRGIETVCDCVQNVATEIADAIVTIVSGKAK